jgi:hypothetical protein
MVYWSGYLASDGKTTISDLIAIQPPHHKTNKTGKNIPINEGFSHFSPLRSS